MHAPIEDLSLVDCGPRLGIPAQPRLPTRLNHHSSRGWRIKRALDVLISGSGLFLLLPLICIICLLVWLTDGGAPIFRQRRVGRNGQHFDCLKIRSMVLDSERRLQQHLREHPEARKEWERSQKLRNDPRITWLGGLLRKTSLDELPQLVNVLKGEMSLVGPRPIVEAEKARYAGTFELCFSVTPGITGLWQVSGRSDCSYAERVQLDIDYAQNWTLSRDLRILARTLPAVLAQRGSR